MQEKNSKEKFKEKVYCNKSIPLTLWAIVVTCCAYLEYES